MSLPEITDSIISVINKLSPTSVSDRWHDLISQSQLQMHEYHRKYSSNPASCKIFDGADRTKVLGIMALRSHLKTRLACYRFARNCVGETVDIGTDDFVFSDGWTPVDWTSYKGAVIFAHGLGDHALFSLLGSSAIPAELGNVRSKLELGDLSSIVEGMRREGSFLRYKQGWASELEKAGYVVYAIDFTGHGFSESYKGIRGYVPRIQNYVDEYLSFILSLSNTGEIPSHVPMNLMGLSMGGYITMKATIDGSARGIIRPNMGPSSAGPGHPVNSLTCCCPALGFDHLKKDRANRFLLPIVSFVSRVFPTLKVVKLASNPHFPYVNSVIARDPLFVKEDVAIAMATSLLREAENLDVAAYPTNIPLAIVHSDRDTMTDFNASQRWVDGVMSQDKILINPSHQWHILHKEPGYLSTIQDVEKWMSSIELNKSDYMIKS